MERRVTNIPSFDQPISSKNSAKSSALSDVDPAVLRINISLWTLFRRLRLVRDLRCDLDVERGMDSTDIPSSGTRERVDTGISMSLCMSFHVRTDGDRIVVTIAGTLLCVSKARIPLEN